MRLAVINCLVMFIVSAVVANASIYDYSSHTNRNLSVFNCVDPWDPVDTLYPCNSFTEITTEAGIDASDDSRYTTSGIHCPLAIGSITVNETTIDSVNVSFEIQNPDNNKDHAGYVWNYTGLTWERMGPYPTISSDFVHYFNYTGDLDEFLSENNEITFMDARRESGGSCLADTYEIDYVRLAVGGTVPEPVVSGLPVSNVGLGLAVISIGEGVFSIS